MKLKNIYSLLLLSAIGLSTSIAQTGTLRGVVIDDEFGDPIIGASVVKKGTTIGTVTDLDGNFSLELPVGTHDISIEYITYQTQTLENIKIEEGKVVVIPNNIRMKEETDEMEEIVVTVEQIRNTENALLTIQKKSANVLDGISSQSIKRSGDGDAAAAIKRVTGVSIQDGKYVYVRGLGDRYTKTQLNGVDIPGLDPDRNAIQMDIFPTNLVNNIIVYKSFTPDLPGDFTGGMVNIETTQFPDDFTFSVNMSLGFNPAMNLNDEYLTYKKSSNDLIASGRNSRELPFPKSTNLTNNFDPSITPTNEVANIMRSFDPTMAAERSTSFLNTGLGFSMGNQKDWKKYKIAYNLAANHSINYEYYENFEFPNYVLSSNTNVFEPVLDTRANGPLGKENVYWSTLAGLYLKSKESKIGLSYFRSQNGQSTAGLFNIDDLRENPAELKSNNLTYTQRQVSNILLHGDHSLNGDDWAIDWNLSSSFSVIDDPDFRNAIYWINDITGEPELEENVGADVSRVWRFLDEQNYTATANFTRNFKLKNGEKTSVKFGGANTYKTRNFETYSYFFREFRQNKVDFTGNPNELFEEKNILISDNEVGIYASGNQEKANSFESWANIAAAYVMHTYPITKQLKAIYGLRAEQTLMYYTGINNQGNLSYDNEKTLDVLNLLPSVNLVYNLKSDMNLRASYSRTVARPSFKEKSLAQIQDLITGREFLGNIDLVQTDIDNIDLRWEYFFGRGEIIAVSTFYKHLTNPIELISKDETSPNSFKPQNVDEANVLGIEFEIRKNLGFITPTLNVLSIGTNLTLVEASVTRFDDGNLSELQSRRNNARDGETIDERRDMMGQAPYIINAYLNFDDDNRLEANVSYNVQGPSLAIAGLGRLPDVYQMPFHSLNFKASILLGANKNWKTSFMVNNILADIREQNYVSYNADNVVFELFSPGTSYNISIGYSL